MSWQTLTVQSLKYSWGNAGVYIQQRYHIHACTMYNVFSFVCRIIGPSVVIAHVNNGWVSWLLYLCMTFFLSLVVAITSQHTASILHGNEGSSSMLYSDWSQGKESELIPIIFLKNTPLTTCTHTVYIDVCVCVCVRAFSHSPRSDYLI